MSDIDIVVVVVMFLAGYWIVSYFWPGSSRHESGEKDGNAPASRPADEGDDGGTRPR